MARDTSNDTLLLHALADDELDAATSFALEQRMAADPALAADYDRIRAVKMAMSRLERPVVSDAFEVRIAALGAVRPLSAARPTRPRTEWWPVGDWRAVAASLVLTACLASGTTYQFLAQKDGGTIEEGILDGHRRSLLAASPIDIASSDRHTVRPWFDAKLGLSPPTPDLAAQGFTLVGGRVDVVGGRPVPSLVYRHKEHLITVVAMPAAPGAEGTQDSAAPSAARSMGGYNVVRWRGPGFGYWAVSDLDAGELDVFVQALRSK